jgi:hypothetical protein
VLIESVKLSFDTAATAFEMCDEPCNWVAFVAESSNTGSGLNFWINTWGAFENGEFDVLLFCQGDVAMSVSHLRGIHSGNN